MTETSKSQKHSKNLTTFAANQEAHRSRTEKGNQNLEATFQLYSEFIQALRREDKYEGKDPEEIKLILETFIKHWVDNQLGNTFITNNFMINLPSDQLEKLGFLKKESINKGVYYYPSVKINRLNKTTTFSDIIHYLRSSGKIKQI